MAKGFSRTVCQNHLSGSLSWWVILVWELTRFHVVCNKEQGWLLYKGTFSGEWEGETFRRETDTGDILGCLQWSTVEWAITGMERARAHCSHQWCNGLSLEIPKQTRVHGWVWWVKVPGKPRGTPVAASSVADFSYERREAEKGPWNFLSWPIVPLFPVLLQNSALKSLTFPHHPQGSTYKIASLINRKKIEAIREGLAHICPCVTVYAVSLLFFPSLFAYSKIVDISCSHSTSVPLFKYWCPGVLRCSWHFSYRQKIVAVRGNRTLTELKMLFV